MGAKDVITLFVPFKAKNGMEGIVREKLILLAGKTVKEEGNIIYAVHEETASPGTFIIYEKWKDQNALDFHMQQEYLKSFLADSAELLQAEIKGIFCKALN